MNREYSPIPGTRVTEKCVRESVHNVIKIDVVYVGQLVLGQAQAVSRIQAFVGETRVHRLPVSLGPFAWHAVISGHGRLL